MKTTNQSERDIIHHLNRRAILKNGGFAESAKKILTEKLDPDSSVTLYRFGHAVGNITVSELPWLDGANNGKMLLPAKLLGYPSGERLKRVHGISFVVGKVEPTCPADSE